MPDNWQLEIYGTIQTWWVIFSSLTTTKEGEELWATTTTTTVDICQCSYVLQEPQEHWNSLFQVVFIA